MTPKGGGARRPQTPRTELTPDAANQLVVSPMVGGFGKRRTELAIWTRIALLAWRAQPGVLDALQTVRRLRAYRRGFLGRDIPIKYVRAGRRYFWDLYAPGFPSPAFDRYITQELSRGGAPVQSLAPATAVLAITRRCPLACEHCCEWKTLNQKDVLSEQDWARIAAEFQALGTSQFFLSGGEPLSRLSAVHAVLEQVAATSDVWLLSSGVGLNERRARELKGAGLTGVVLSVDHPDGASHDRFRGYDGAYAAALRAAACVRDAGLVLGLALVPSVDSATDDWLDRYRRLARELGAGFLQILEPRAVGRYEGSAVELPAERQRVLERFARATAFAREHAPDPLVAYPDETRRQSGCQGGNRYVYVDTRGALYACPFCRSGPEPLAGELGVSGALERLRAGGCPRAASSARASAVVQLVQVRLGRLGQG